MPILASDLLKTVEKLGKKHPKRRRTCQYVTEEGKGCCIVGKALLKLGADPQLFLDDPELNESTGVRSLFLVGVVDLVNDISEEEMRKLYDAQTMQDDGVPWGETIKALK